jgi:hypothetical protein
MALLTGSDTLDTTFTPAAGDFIAQVTGGGAVSLMRKTASGAAAFAFVGTIQANTSVTVSNPVAGAVYKFTAVSGTPAVRADQ